MGVTEWLAGAGHRTETVYLAPDPDALSMAGLQRQADEGADSGSLADSLDTVRARARETSWRFTVGTVPASQWNHLLDGHPPTDSQRDEAVKVGVVLEFDRVTFPAAAIAAALREAVNPSGDRLTFDRPGWADGRLTVDPEAVELADAVWDTFPLGEWELLWRTVAGMHGVKQAAARQSFVTGSTPTRSGAR